MQPHKKDWRRALRSLYVWHRWLGVCSALLVLWLSVTGILLNHSTQLGIDRARAQAPWLLQLYGIETPPPSHGFKVGEHWLSQAGDMLFLDGHATLELHDELVGAVGLPAMLVVATPTSLVLLSHDGQWIESLGSGMLPGAITGIAQQDDRLLVRTAGGLLVGNEDLTHFSTDAGQWPGVASVPQPLPDDVARLIQAQGAGVSLGGERVLADLHSGRIFGRYGPLVMDLAALAFMILAASGLWLWWRYRKTQHRRMRG